MSIFCHLQPRQAALSLGQQLQPREQQGEQHPQQGASRTTARPGQSTTGSRLRTMDSQDRPPASQPLPSKDRLVQRLQRGFHRGSHRGFHFSYLKRIHFTVYGKKFIFQWFHTKDALPFNCLYFRRSESSWRKSLMPERIRKT